METETIEGKAAALAHGQVCAVYVSQLDERAGVILGATELGPMRSGQQIGDLKK
jgi:hypothetical protein